ncbi:hypothetical protein ATL17_0785 [Maritalea mobilis]|uniref:Uncharacterized protein n=1 Tax=Maritalea mobilis TaxID=483324 RepID=A0A4R6VTJ5_9HYPH|nr:hypothetical protein [Maritalea mobilis]TDQ66781.1 hypothetical protein ATL17_0785 [Maritalea mobilis]
MSEKKSFFRNIVSAVSNTRGFYDHREEQKFVATQSYRNLLGSYDHTNGF